MALLRSVARAPATQSRRLLSSEASAPLMWKLAHGMFDAEVPMTSKFPGIADPVDVAPTAPGDPRSTTLPNGVRVVSQDLGGSVTSLALFVGAGSRHENPYTAGVSFLLERLAYKGSPTTSKFRTTRDMERSGAVYNAAASRETIAFAAEGLRPNVPDIAAIIAHAGTAPALNLPARDNPEWDAAMSEIKTQTAVVKADLDQFTKDPNNILNESIHSVAFHGNTLGLPLVPSADKLDAITPETVHEFTSQNFTPDRMVLSAANYDHERLVELAEKHLGFLPASASGTSEVSRYTGGGQKVAGPAGQGGHISIGFKGLSWQDADLVPICVLHTLLGGGGSFSSGGPGKGMYTRLYSQVLNQHSWVTSAIAYNHCYSDSGIFGIQASCDDAAHLNHLVEIVGSQITKIAAAPTADELTRAKAMTKSSLVMNLESRAVVCEDLGRQMLSSNTYADAAQLIKKIDAVSADDLRRVASKVLTSTPSIVTLGEEYATQDYATIEAAIKAQVKLSA